MYVGISWISMEWEEAMLGKSRAHSRPFQQCAGHPWGPMMRCCGPWFQWRCVHVGQSKGDSACGIEQVHESSENH